MNDFDDDIMHEDYDDVTVGEVLMTLLLAVTFLAVYAVTFLAVYFALVVVLPLLAIYLVIVGSLP